MLADRYTRTAVVLHWLIALLITANVILIYTVDHLPDEWVRGAIDSHKSTGITVLGLVLMRIFWRAANRREGRCPRRTYRALCADDRIAALRLGRRSRVRRRGRRSRGRRYRRLLRRGRAGDRHHGDERGACGASEIILSGHHILPLRVSTPVRLWRPFSATQSPMANDFITQKR